MSKLKYPLRKVICSVPDKNWLVELECGHTMCGSGDIYGRTFPTRQRCIYCEPLNKEKRMKLDTMNWPDQTQVDPTK